MDTKSFIAGFCAGGLLGSIGTLVLITFTADLWEPIVKRWKSRSRSD